MSVEEEFKLKAIPKASYAGNLRKFVQTGKHKRLEKVSTRVASDLNQRDKFVAKQKKREERCRMLEKIQEDVNLWTVRELFEYLSEEGGKYGRGKANSLRSLVDRICREKMEGN